MLYRSGLQGALSSCLLIYLATSPGVLARGLSSSRQLSFHIPELPVEAEPEPEGPSESIPDTRVLVNDTTAFPFNAIGLVQIYDSTGEVAGLCSGALIRPNIVLTAAHCLLDPDTDTATPAADFTPSYNPTGTPMRPYGTAAMLNWEIPKAFAQSVSKGDGEYDEAEQDSDFGVMLLNSSFPHYMSYSFNGSSSGDQIVFTAGYPGDEGACADFQTTGSDTGCAMYTSNCTDAAIQPGAAYDTFACYGYEGQSGSPIWLQNATTGNSTITGVLTSGDAEEGEAFTILSQHVYNQIETYITQLADSASPAAAPEASPETATAG